MFDHEVDVTFNAATNISEESAEAVAIREASSLTLPGFDDLVHYFHHMESVNLFTYCFLRMLKFLNEEHPYKKVLMLPLGFAPYCERGCGPDCRSGCLTLFYTD
jgi:hypothetical protein